MSTPPSSSQDLDKLMSNFVREGWSLLSGLEAAIDGLASAQSDRAVDMLGILAHRLAGSAALYELPQLAALGTGMRRAIEGYPDADDTDQRKRRLVLQRALNRARQHLDSLAGSGGEQAGRVRSLSTSDLQSLAPATAPDRPPPPLSQPAPSEEPSELPSDQVVAALHLFRAQSPEVLEYFVPEAEEHVEGLLAALAQIEATGETAQTIGDLFRRVHTLKGAAYTVGCLPIGGLSHALEDVLVEVRDGRCELSGDVLRTAEAGADVLRGMLEAVQGAQPDRLADRHADASQRLNRLARGAESETAREEPSNRASGPAEAPAGGAATETPAAPRPFLSQSTIRVALDRLDLLMNLVGEAVTVRGRVAHRVERLGKLGGAMSSIRGRMAHAIAEFQTRHLDPDLVPADAGSRADRGSPAADDPATGEPAGSDEIDQIFAELEWDRYDDFNILARRIGELASDVAEVQGELDRLTRGLRDETSELAGLVRDLRSGVGRARMVPVGTLFGRFHRLVRGLAQEEGKQVELAISGQGTEIDNAIMEAVSDPVMHLVQNAVAHGIEDPRQRRSAGKPAAGTIGLSAYPQGHFVHIEVSDDGRGIDRARLRRRAVDLGLADEREIDSLDDLGVLELIYLPGLSTHDGANRAAGRGVGMDVVRDNIARIGGEIEISSRPRRGTRFTLRLPLTLLVSEALKIEAGGEVMALPMAAVRTTREVTPAELRGTRERPTISIDGEWMPFVRIASALALDTPPQWDRLDGIVVQSGGRVACLAVDDLLGIEEVVIQAIGDFFSGLGFLSGATVSAEGRVILLLDPGVLATPKPIDLLGGSARKRPQALPLPAASAPKRARPKVLLADDSLSVRKVLGSRLGRAGFDVVTAADGEEAIERLRQDEFDALITDLEMPRVNGYELIQATRRQPATRELPIVVITTRAGDKHLELARRVGATRCFAKPVGESVLSAHLRTVTSARSAVPQDAHGEIG